MFRLSHRAATAAAAAVSILAVTPAIAQELETVTVTAERLENARVGIQTQVGASTYTITAQEIQNQPGGDNSLLNQVVLQAPGVAADSFGQLHVRGEHNGLQYRIDGVIIPDGISVFSQTLDPRFVDSMKLVTGALPAEYGLRTAGIIDVSTKTGIFDNGGSVSLYGGSHSELNPSFEYGGSDGNLNYFVSGDYLTDDLGIESPDGVSNPLHDRTKQYHGFAFAQDILDDNSSLTAMYGISNDIFQIPNRRGVEPSSIGIDGLGPCADGTSFSAPPCAAGVNRGLTVNGQYAFLSNGLNENQREITHFGILSYLRSMGQLDLTASVFGRYSSLFFTPDPVSDLLFNGIAQTAYKRDVAYGLQTEAAYHLGDDHTIRAGVIYQADDIASRTSSDVLATDPVTGNQTAPDTPIAIPDNATKHAWSYSLYLQDEWQILDTVTLNYGLRWDQFQAFDSESQLSPRVNAVWKPIDGTTVHLGYSRYFSPPPIELVGNTDLALFVNTTAAPGVTTDDTPKAERADYYDLGVEQVLEDGLTVGVDSFDKQSRNLVDEGQFGAPIILTPFNYRSGRQYGVELTGNYDAGPFSTYANLAYERAAGKDIVSSQFNFSQDDLNYIATHYIPLDHQQILSGSAGASYKLWSDTLLSADLLYGSGLRRGGLTPNGEHVPAYVQVNLGLSHTFDLAGLEGLQARIDVINLFDVKYEIRDGTGVGVGAPQFGPRRGFFAGLTVPL
jgi:outer membrane receptor protein involved in Fe transport